MIGSKERRLLVERFGHQTPGPAWILARCAACLAALVLVAAGPWIVHGAAGFAGPATTTAAGDSGRAQEMQTAAQRQCRGQQNGSTRQGERAAC